MMLFVSFTLSNLSEIYFGSVQKILFISDTGQIIMLLKIIFVMITPKVYKMLG